MVCLVEKSNVRSSHSDSDGDAIRFRALLSVSTVCFATYLLAVFNRMFIYKRSILYVRATATTTINTDDKRKQETS